MNFELDWLKRWNVYEPARTVLSADRDISYRELYHLSNAIAADLKKRGIGRGDRVAVLAKNHWFFVATLFGCQRAGAILLPLNFRLTKTELDYIVADADPKVILAEDDMREKLSVNALSWDRWINEMLLAPTNAIEFETNAEDSCLLLYTSGTTGHPKGALINHRMLFWNSINTRLRLDLTQSDVTLSFAPFFHTGGWNVLLTPYLHIGARTLMLEKFDPEKVLSLIEKEKVTMIFGVPTMLDLMARTENFANTDLSSLRFVVVGGEPMPLELIRTWESREVRIRQGYGLTEFGPNVFSLSEQDSMRKIGSIGFPNFYIQARVVNSEGRDVQQGETGELWLKGPVGTPGYWRNEKATGELYEGDWLKTGDLVRQDRDGYFYVAGRKKEMYISGGENVYPAEIEQALRTHPKVLEAAVVGIPDSKWGEAGQAFVVCKSQLSEDEVLEHCRSHLARVQSAKTRCFSRATSKKRQRQDLETRAQHFFVDSTDPAGNMILSTEAAK